VVPYDEAMLTQAALPEEAVDMTGAELHQLVLNRLVDVLRFIFGDRALVLSDVFLRIEVSAGRVRLFLPDGREFIDAQAEMARVGRLSEATVGEIFISPEP
jgi:hypothetical protein